MKFPNEYRARHPLGFEHKDGDHFGWFMIPYNGKIFAAMADGSHDTWEHVSVSSKKIPTWEEMCFVKGLFWEKEDCVVQYHPPESCYINMATNCLHLWKYKGEMPMPPSWMVGFK